MWYDSFTGGIRMKIKASHPIAAEFLREQLPIIIGTFGAGVLISYLGYGYLPGLGRAFPVAGIRVSLLHLLGMGIGTGWLMGLVGEASGILSLPYSMSVLGFTSPGVSPTNLVLTLINPLGALLGYRRTRQWNLDLALWPCLGALFGAPIGPFIRYYVLSDPAPFKIVVSAALLLMGVYLWVQITPWYLKKTFHQKNSQEKFNLLAKERPAFGKHRFGLPADFRITTVERSLRRIRIEYWGEEKSFSSLTLLGLGFLVGVIASTLGVGGGFLLVPIMATLFGLPMYVLVAATIPFVITLSGVGLISYLFIIPTVTGNSVPPDWGFGFFAGSGAVFGSWLASKTQRFIPEKLLKPLLGTLTAATAILNIVSYFAEKSFDV